MADPQGFLKAGRELPERRPVDVRIREKAEEGLAPAEEDTAEDMPADGGNLDDFFE